MANCYLGTVTWVFLLLNLGCRVVIVLSRQSVLALQCKIFFNATVADNKLSSYYTCTLVLLCGRHVGRFTRLASPSVRLFPVDT